ncbi:glycosyltransferase family 4 protein [Campylobacter porcelli]|uniref:Glycosyltransferase family 4 protein n=1 Tax=Campylobacter porcelli TaxID=1660073 RepID=A0ABU7M5H8_9BACT|nr:glycosyltransferase family 4 protein [Campylobacter sp. CX2-4855-23]MEE3776723.1 glycosyltransferase family 4 protein [Campylobacter sp. CX2-4080-23]
MKNITILEINSTNKNQRFLERLKSALSSKGFNPTSRNYDNIKGKNPIIKLLKINKLAKKQKSDELYVCLDRFDSADIYLASDGVQKIYKRLDKFWFLNPLSLIRSKIEKNCINNSAKIITNSNLTRYQLETIYDIKPNKISTIYPGINLPTQVQKGSAKMQLCKELSLDMEFSIILFISNNLKNDGVAEFIKLLSQIQNKINAIIISSDKSAPKYRKMAKKLGVRAIFKQPPKTLNRYYEAADIFVLPSLYNPFSTQILEALSYGSICFTTANNGASEILGDEFIIKSTDDTAKYIDELLNNHDLMVEISAKNIELAKDFTTDKSLNQIIKIISENIH